MNAVDTWAYEQFGSGGRFFLYVLLVAWIISIVLTIYMVSAKGRSFWEGLFLGVIGGPLGLIVAAGLPSKLSDKRR
jgi:hypothetical protein